MLGRSGSSGDKTLVCLAKVQRESHLGPGDHPESQIRPSLADYSGVNAPLQCVQTKHDLSVKGVRFTCKVNG